MIDTAIVLAGGKGTRLKDITMDTPKPLVDFLGKPLLDYQLTFIKQQGIKNVILTLGYGADVIQEFCDAHDNFGLNIDYFIEDNPMGTAGIVVANQHMLSEQFFVIYSDTFLGVNFKKFADYHNHNQAMCSVFLYPTDHPEDSDLFELDDNQYLQQIHPAPHDKDHQNLSNQALYVMNKEILKNLSFAKQNIDFVKDIFTQCLEKDIKIKGYVCDDYIKDLGTPERYAQVIADYQSGKIY